jgi:tRNA (guanine37-N1)-methyltransferase
MKFTFVTLFPNIVSGYFSESILAKAIENKIIEIEYSNPRDFTTDKHGKVDAPMVGGGAGMLMSPQPLFDTIECIKSKDNNTHIIMMTPVAKKFTQNDAIRLSKKSHIVLISGRYEGIDERIIETSVDEVFSIGDFIITGGELASLVVCDSISRQVENVLGNTDSLSGESFEENILEAPAFTKPDNFKEKSIVSEYLKGNHGKITALKRALSLYKTEYFRPDLYSKIKQKAKK